jgi:hypothetical protein
MAASTSKSPDVPNELIFEGMNSNRESSEAALFKLVSMPLIVGVACSILITPTAGIVGLIGSGAFSIWRWKRKPRESRLLRVENNNKDLVIATSKSKISRERISDLMNVELDIKTIERIQDGSSAIPAVRFINSTVAPPVDTARIVLVFRDGTRIRLSDEYLAHMDASEWLGKIRVFLRKHGWVPRDEQGPESDPAPESEDEEDS